MSLHSLTFSLIMIGVGAWQFWRAGRMVRANAEIEAASIEERRTYEAHGYPPTQPAKVRVIGALLIAVGIAALVVPMLLERTG